MKRVAAVLIALGIVPLACGPSTQQACSDFVNAFCTRYYTCYTGSALTTLQSLYGQTADDCKVALAKSSNCQSAQATCPSGLVYDTGAAETCVTNFSNTSCDQLVQPGFQVPGCAATNICH